MRGHLWEGRILSEKEAEMLVRTRVKTGRNDYCPCGSGLKYKNCHLLITNQPLPLNLPMPVLKQLREGKRAVEAEARIRKKERGEVRPIISCDTRFGKLVAVGDKIFKTARWADFHGFLLEHALHLIDEEWIKSELAKASGTRNTLCKWYGDTFCKIEESRIGEKQKRNLSFMPLLSLAYDLYILRDHFLLQKRILSRLRHHDQFSGARYELFVAVTFIRAGFELTYEDEDDRRRPHVEFQAVHKTSAQRVLVEAKQSVAAKYNYGKLINGATRKAGSDPLVVFVDFNKSPDLARSYLVQGNRKIQQMLSRINTSPNGHDLYNLLVFTNHPYQFATENEPYPERKSLVLEAKNPLLIPKDRKMVTRLTSAVMQYGNIPKDFPESP
jgi:hypothetical protein